MKRSKVKLHQELQDHKDQRGKSQILKDISMSSQIKKWELIRGKEGKKLWIHKTKDRETKNRGDAEAH